MMTALDPVTQRMTAAEALIRDAGAIARGFFDRRGELVVEQKSAAQDLVSQADRTVEDFIREKLSDLFPEDGLLGEERGLHTGSSGFLWVIDPIDGTSPFLFDQPNWCISIALCKGDDIVAGLIFAPVHGEVFQAQRGKGAFLNGRRLSVDQAASVQSSNIAMGAVQTANPAGVGSFVTRLYAEGGVMFRIGSGALMLCYVAANRIAGYFDPNINSWDCYAGIVMVEEAGGVTRFEGDTDHSGRLYAGNARVLADMLRYTDGLVI